MITNHAGAANITGALADGAAFNQTVPVSQDGYVPIYANLYSGKGLLLGWINLDLTNTADVGLTWIHPGTRFGIIHERVHQRSSRQSNLPFAVDQFPGKHWPPDKSVGA